MRCYTGNQIVTRSVDTVLIQFNEGYRNMAIKNPLPGSGVAAGLSAAGSVTLFIIPKKKKTI